MKTEIEIWNGSGWNNYAALRELKTLQIGTRGFMAANGVQRVEIAPYNSERPYGIAARYYNEDGELMFTQSFDQNDSASWIRERVYALLIKGIQATINERAREISRKAYIQKIAAWRRAFDKNFSVANKSASADRLRAKFGKLRELGGKKVSRKTCWNLTYAVIAGEISYKDAVAKFN